MRNLLSEVLAVLALVLAVGAWVFLLVWVKRMKKALGVRKDWKRRFDRMREMLHL